MVPVLHPHLGQLHLEVLPDLLVDDPGGDRLDGEGPVLVTVLRSHQHLTAAHHTQLQRHVHSEDPGLLALLYQVDGVPPGAGHDGPVRSSVW